MKKYTPEINHGMLKAENSNISWDSGAIPVQNCYMKERMRHRFYIILGTKIIFENKITKFSYRIH